LFRSPGFVDGDILAEVGAGEAHNLTAQDRRRLEVCQNNVNGVLRHDFLSTGESLSRESVNASLAQDAVYETKIRYQICQKPL
jgi:hypothetical protein